MSQKHCSSHCKMISSPGFVFLFMLPLSNTQKLSLLVSHPREDCRMKPVHIHPSWPLLKLKKSSNVRYHFIIEANAIRRGDLTDLSLG